MDFSELEAIEGLRWSWHSWPVSKPEVSSLVVPLSILSTPLMAFNELPILPYEPLNCSGCEAVLNPYARVDYVSKIWSCSFCYRKNPFPKSYAHINENNIPAELFPTYSTVERVVDACSPEEELTALKRELLHVITRLPENALVGLVVFDAMVMMYDLGFTECLRVVIFHGEREVSSEQAKQFLGLHHMKQSLGKTAVQKQGFLMPVSDW
ncbi:hypothetical protein CASFOL_005462 [Castilleja foliolosa]|uniref:Protein transport protein SEC23 n=1 Tax=Castilleja foliolosa TaxID=1961234 RepID=A0ABD3E7I4_9LAMI